MSGKFKCWSSFGFSLRVVAPATGTLLPVGSVQAATLVTCR